MLVFSATQITSLENDLRSKLGRDVVDSLRESSPHSLQGLTGAEIAERLSIAVEKSAFYRLHDLKDFQAYIRLSLTVGQNFDQHPPFNKILNAQGVPVALRMTRLFKAATELDWTLAAVRDVVSRSHRAIEAEVVDLRARALVPFTHQHAEPYYRQSMHPDVWRTAGIRPFLSLTECRAYIESMQLEDGTHRLAIVEGNIGFVGLITLHYRADEAHLSYWVGRPFWGRGIGTDAIQLLLDQLERRARHVVITASTVSANLPSIKLLEKSHFQRVPNPSSDTNVVLTFRWNL